MFLQKGCIGVRAVSPSLQGKVKVQCFFFGLFFKIKKQGLSSGVVHEDALSSYTPKMPCLSLISDFSWSQVGEQSYPCSCPGEKKYEQVSNTHQVFIQESLRLFLPTLLFLITGFEAPVSAKGEKSQNIRDNGRPRTWGGFELFGGFFQGLEPRESFCTLHLSLWTGDLVL